MIPRFSAETMRALPLCDAPDTPAQGRRKPPKAIPGLTRPAGAAIAPERLSPSAEIADTLLAAGVLRDSDWAGSLEGTINAGLARWANAPLADGGLGCGELAALHSLRIVYVDDLAGHYSGGNLGSVAWREMFAGRPDRPVGAFGLDTGKSGRSRSGCAGRSRR